MDFNYVFFALLSIVPVPAEEDGIGKVNLTVDR